MPADTAEKRFSAMNLASPWRGVNVTPSAVNQAERQAVMYMYSGILASAAVAGHPTMRRWGHVQHMPTTAPRMAGIR